MTARLDPLDASETIVNTYQRYLRSLIAPRDPALAAALHDAIGEAVGTGITRGPLLEATPPYQTSATLGELATEGVVHSGLVDGRIDVDPDRPLYRHQEQAIRKAAAGRNLIVATGTGSGKTESFLLPILSELAAERASGTLGPGVRALLLYPMNALANDQMKRLRKLLAGSPEITFGRYTGDTKDSTDDAKARFALQNPGEPVLPNELLSREQMRATPPHLLLTNYAMLEYLLLRPLDLTLFQGEHGGHWQFVVVDEAHVYDGTRGAELAMLLRRLRDRVVDPARVDGMRCIATSATVGADRHAVTTFAQTMFSAPFEYIDDDPARQDLVVSERVPVPEGAVWGPLPAAGYASLRDAENRDEAILAAAQAHGYNGDDPGEALALEKRLRALREQLKNGPVPLPDVAIGLFPDVDTRTGQAQTTALVQLANATRIRKKTPRGGEESTPVLSARFHLFARATEGAFACFGESGPHVTLTRREQCERCHAAAFEFAACRRCGTVHLQGVAEAIGKKTVFRSRRGRDEGRRMWLLLDEHVAASGDEDDETLLDAATAASNSKLTADPWSLCTQSGCLTPGTVTTCPDPACGGAPARPVRRLSTKTGSSELSSCLGCGGRGGRLIRSFESGNDAAVAVLATALYQLLPPMEDAEQASLPGGGRKILFFSDSRQAAAYFAPYLEDSYADVERRRLLYQGLIAATRRADDDEEVLRDDLVAHTAKAATNAGVFNDDVSRQGKLRVVETWAQQELLSLDERMSLEGTGLLRWALRRKPEWTAPKPLLDLGLTNEQVWGLIEELLRSVRRQGAVGSPEEVDPKDEVFEPRVGPIYLRSRGAQSKQKVLSWLPTRGTNRRVDYLGRILAVLGREDNPLDLLEHLWKFLVDDARRKWLTALSPAQLGVVYQLNHTALAPRLVTPDDQMWQCDRCRLIAGVNVAGVCPTLNCAGRLREWSLPDATTDEHHYRTLYRTIDPVPLTVKEHTAQWRSDQAAKIQQDFIAGRLNALSCSTTFELGVDVGELQTVVLRNMPPTTANYIQRAGRAGRRTESAALVLTYAQRRSHDLTQFARPERMIAGQMRAPFVPLENPRIDRRHVHSVALAAFWRDQFEQYGTVWRKAGEFFKPDVNGSVPATRVAPFLRPVPEGVSESLTKVIPSPAEREDLGITDGSWIEKLETSLTDVLAELTRDLATYEQLRQDAFANRKDDLARIYGKIIRTLEERDLIGLLANRNILPKYGFPVDTVELRVNHSPAPEASQIELSRDLTSAVYEYAPGAEIVAGGRLWTSAGVYRLPNRDLERRVYTVCPACGHFRDAIDTLDPACPRCDTPLTGMPRRYVLPEHGFVAGRQPRRPGASPPRGSWHGGTHVVSSGAEVEDFKAELSGGTVRARSGTRGQLVSLNDGPGGAGYLICKTCGFGQSAMTRRPTEHRHPMTDKGCRGSLESLSLAHKYETDVLEITVDGPVAAGADGSVWRSVLYALIEGASVSLEIARDDIDGTLFRNEHGTTSMMIFDTVPGGAGNVHRLGRNLDTVLRAALARVRDCECGPETSCYRCLRVFRNELFHEALRRGTALDVLARLLGEPTVYAEMRAAEAVRAFTLPDAVAYSVTTSTAPGVPFRVIDVPDFVFETVPRGQIDLWDGRIVLAQNPDRQPIIGRLALVREDGDLTAAEISPLIGAPNRADLADTVVLAVAL
ncbi:DEAD/DEAH box helicase [Pseudofrankia sp. BMG5.36]|uniref:DEAD/DEAH box helicase n=1 Tax=Pseudofrankia sp. BMG5.36 TaxID=1834512 RepID=UPI0008DB1EC8|nr:DEAD/DEAH box helicase [Pseudofrankia sp. BMG5.36]OHV62900.1 DEAD/DEAH box helicase [Pseudofrankia sp. BMG5.36]